MTEQKKQLSGLIIALVSVVIFALSVHFLMEAVEAGIMAEKSKMPVPENNPRIIGTSLVFCILSFISSIIGSLRCLRHTSEESKLVNYAAKSIGAVILLSIVAFFAYGILNNLYRGL